MKDTNQQLHLDQPTTYKIKIQGRLNESWSDWFDNMAITVEKDGDDRAITTLTGTVSDQTALHGLLARIRDLGLPLLMVQHVGNLVKPNST
jgi:hypothetical protein